MAIAIVATGSTTADVGAGSSITLSHTVASGSNRLMVLGGGYQTGGPFTACTFNGDGATNGAGDIIKRDSAAAENNNTVGVFSIVAPDEVTGDAVITKTGTGNQMDIAVANYTGCKQTGLPDATGSANTSSGSGLSYSVTTAADDCWIVTMITNTAGGTISGTSNYTHRQAPRNGVSFGDSAASVGAAGSKTVSFTGDSGRWWAASASYAPAADVAATVVVQPNLLLMGAG